MTLTEKKVNVINEKLQTVGVKIYLFNGLKGTSVCKDNMVFASVEEISKVIKELQTIKEIFEEETGLML